jgi:alkylation response protein AidB-like acyl-CoA dehydrogenase
MESSIPKRLRCLLGTVWEIYHSAIEYDQGRLDPGCVSIAQLEVGKRLIGMVDEALQIFGGYGYMAEQAIEHHFRDVWAIGFRLNFALLTSPPSAS